MLSLITGSWEPPLIIWHSVYFSSTANSTSCRLQASVSRTERLSTSQILQAETLLPPSPEPAITLTEDRRGSKHIHGDASVYSMWTLFMGPLLHRLPPQALPKASQFLRAYPGSSQGKRLVPVKVVWTSRRMSTRSVAISPGQASCIKRAPKSGHRVTYRTSPSPEKFTASISTKTQDLRLLN